MSKIVGTYIYLKLTYLFTDEYNPEKYTVGTKYNSQWVEGFLTVKSLEPEDGGEYVCEALQENPLVDNCSNTMSLNVTLNVNCKCSYFRFKILSK